MVSLEEFKATVESAKEAKDFIKLIQELDMWFLDTSLSGYEMKLAKTSIKLLKMIDASSVITEEDLVYFAGLRKKVFSAYSTHPGYEMSEVLFYNLYSFLVLNTKIIFNVKNTLYLKLSMFKIGIKIGLHTLSELNEYLDKELLLDNDSSIILDLEFGVSKGIKHLNELMYIYIKNSPYHELEFYEVIISKLLLNTTLDKFKEKNINQIEFGRFVKDIAMESYPISRLLYLGNYPKHFNQVLEKVQFIVR